MEFLFYTVKTQNLGIYFHFLRKHSVIFVCIQQSIIKVKQIKVVIYRTYTIHEQLKHENIPVYVLRILLYPSALNHVISHLRHSDLSVDDNPTVHKPDNHKYTLRPGQG
jgi:hypothetical protein